MMISDQLIPVDPWEEAYARFETPEEEIAKFRKRLQRVGADNWPRDAEVVELFCGRGNGLHALQQMGFSHIEGVDLSAALLAQYTGNCRLYEADCRQLPFANNTKDVAIVQGGLHHLPTLPDDLEQTLSEIQRVLRVGGRFMAVEPWPTLFLSLVHAACHNGRVQCASPKLKALATMIHYERTTYEQWLSRPQEIQQLLSKYFVAESRVIGWGKIFYVGRKDSDS